MSLVCGTPPTTLATIADSSLPAGMLLTEPLKTAAVECTQCVCLVFAKFPEARIASLVCVDPYCCIPVLSDTQCQTAVRVIAGIRIRSSARNEYTRLASRKYGRLSWDLSCKIFVVSGVCNRCLDCHSTAWCDHIRDRGEVEFWTYRQNGGGEVRTRAGLLPSGIKKYLNPTP